MEVYEKQNILDAFERAKIDAEWDGRKFSLEDFENAINFTPKFQIESSEWIWDPDGIDWGIGAWRCESCKCKNANLFGAPPKNPMRCAGSKYCPNCGHRMFYKE